MWASILAIRCINYYSNIHYQLQLSSPLLLYNFYYKIVATEKYILTSEYYLYLSGCEVTGRAADMAETETLIIFYIIFKIFSVFIF